MLLGSDGISVLVGVAVDSVGTKMVGVLVFVGISVKVTVGGILVAVCMAIGGGNVGGNAWVGVSSGVGVDASVGGSVGAGAATVDKLQLKRTSVIVIIPAIRLSLPFMMSSEIAFDSFKDKINN